jgi:DNA-binding transcriptional regulator YhcF (GntR family)
MLHPKPREEQSPQWRVYLSPTFERIKHVIITLMSETKYKLRNLVIPEHIYKDNRLNWTSARVYAFIYSYTNPFYFSNEHLAEMFNVHYETISTAMGQLEEFGLVKLTYKPKAGGGKIRLSEVTYSDKAKSLSGSKNFEATTKRSHLGKDIKDNNIKGKNLPKIDSNNIEEEFNEWKTNKKARKQGKGRVFPQRSGFGSAPSYQKKEYQVREKKGAHGEHII